MNSQISKLDVFLYFANQLDRARRRELEAACETNAQVRQWFADLTPTDEELEHEAMPKVVGAAVQPHSAAKTYQSVERDEQADRVRRWWDRVRDVIASGKPGSAPPGDIAPAELLLGGNGALLLRMSAPLEMAAAQDTFSVPAAEVPCIHPDYAGGRLVIRQTLDRVPSGVVEVRVVRRRGANDVEALPPKRISLEHTEPSGEEPYWYADIPLKSLIGDFLPGNDFIYCIEAALGA